MHTGNRRKRAQPLTLEVLRTAVAGCVPASTLRVACGRQTPEDKVTH